MEAAAKLLRPGARVFLQSDVLEAAEWMRDTFEQHGSSAFAPCTQLHTPQATFQAASPPPDRGAAASSEQQTQWQSRWAAAGWLRDNPLVRACGRAGLLHWGQNT